MVVTPAVCPLGQHGGVPTPVRSWPHLCGLLAGVLQVNFLLELALPGHLPLLTSLVSELSAPGQPFSWVYRSADLVAAVFTVELARLVAVRWSTRLGRATAGLVAAYALGLGVAALVPTDCADSLGRCGGHVLLDGGAAWRERAHDLVSIAGALSLLLASATGALLLRRRALGRRAGLLAGTGLAASLLGGLALAQVLVDLTRGQGVVQRLQVLLSSVLVWLLGEAVARLRV